MKKVFLSADIEGTCGIAHWDETLPDKRDYPRFQEQMTREVAAACEGLGAEGVTDIFVRDAHDTARNLKAELLPENVEIFRGWGRDPWSMMSGIDESYEGVVFTGYHSAASWNGSPLSHTMNLQNNYVKINEETASELMINSLTASYYGVPVLMLTGDQMLCQWMNEACPGTLTVPVSHGAGQRLRLHASAKGAKAHPGDSGEGGAPGPRLVSVPHAGAFCGGGQLSQAF